MTTATQTDDKQATLSVPKDVEEKFPEFLTGIRKSRSMDDEERQYWVDVLPIMSGDQLANLKDILDNEQKQIAEAEASYSNSVDEAAQEAKNAFDAEAYREKKTALKALEKEHEEEEAAHEKALLSELENL